MERNSPQGSEPADSRWHPLKSGAPAALGADDGPQSSVLRSLQAKTNAKLGVQLPETPGEPESTVKLSPESTPLRDVAGRYQVLGEIGRGGVGVVFKGHDVDLGRDVALKVLREEFSQHPEVLARFVEEAQIGGQLQHPGIVPVYEIGLQNGERPFFAMKLVKGETLAEQLARRADPSEDRRRLLGIFEQVCQTLAYAHARRVVHRDLKPGNVMIGAFGEVQVVDWGFAKVLPEPGEPTDEPAQRTVEQAQVSVISTVRSQPSASSHSVAGSMMGTPAYMPLEQALGDVEHMDQRSDVFGLGAILCELLTGRAVYLVDDGDLIQQAARGDVSKARGRIEKCGADESLIALCKQCLSPARLARPASAREVAEQVGAYLTSVEERAREAQIAAAEERVKTHEERRARRLTLALATAVVAILTLGGGGWLWVAKGRQERMESTAGTVAEILAEAQRLRGEAQGAPVGDLSRWDAALAEAGRAEALVASAEVSKATKQSVAALALELQEGRAEAQRQADAKRRDDEMLATLSEIRIPPDQAKDIEVFGKREGERRDAAYTAAFRSYGLDVDELSAEEAIRRIQPSPAAASLAIALDDWALARWTITRWTAGKDWTTWAWILQVARGIDPDENRCMLRDRIASGSTDVEILKALAAGEESSRWPAATLLLLAQTLSAANARDVAVDVLRKAQRAHPDDFDVNMMLGVFLTADQREDYDEALRYFTAARALRPRSIDVLVLIAGAMVKNRPDEAIAVCRDVLAIDPDRERAHYILGAALLNTKDYEAAEGELRRAIEINGSEAEAHTMLGWALQAQGHLDEAIASYRKAIELDPKNLPAYLVLGTVLGDKGDHDGAIVAFRKAIELDPMQADAQYFLGRALEGKGDLDGAIAAWRKALEIDPEAAEASNSLAWLLATSADPARRDAVEAVRLAKRAVELVPDANHFNTLGAALCCAGEWSQAIEALDQSIQLNRTTDESAQHLNAENQCFLAIAHAHLGELDKARAVFALAKTWHEAHSQDTNAAETARFLDEARAAIQAGAKR